VNRRRGGLDLPTASCSRSRCSPPSAAPTRNCAGTSRQPQRRNHRARLLAVLTVLCRSSAIRAPSTPSGDQRHHHRLTGITRRKQEESSEPPPYGAGDIRVTDTADPTIVGPVTQ